MTGYQLILNVGDYVNINYGFENGKNDDINFRIFHQQMNLIFFSTKNNTRYAYLIGLYISMGSVYRNLIMKQNNRL